MNGIKHNKEMLNKFLSILISFSLVFIYPLQAAGTVSSGRTAKRQNEFLTLQAGLYSVPSVMTAEERTAGKMSCDYLFNPPAETSITVFVEKLEVCKGYLKDTLNGYRIRFNDMAYEGVKKENKPSAWKIIQNYFAFEYGTLRPYLQILKQIHKGARERNLTSIEEQMEKTALFTAKNIRNTRNSLWDIVENQKVTYYMTSEVMEGVVSDLKRLGHMGEDEYYKIPEGMNINLIGSVMASQGREKNPLIPFNTKRLFADGGLLEKSLAGMFNLQKNALTGRKDSVGKKGNPEEILAAKNYCSKNSSVLGRIGQTEKYTPQAEAFAALSHKRGRQVDDGIVGFTAKGVADTYELTANTVLGAVNGVAYAANWANPFTGKQAMAYYLNKFKQNLRNPHISKGIHGISNLWEGGVNLIGAAGKAGLGLGIYFATTEPRDLSNWMSDAAASFMAGGALLGNVITPSTSYRDINRNSYINSPGNLYKIKNYYGDDNVAAWAAYTGLLALDVILMGGNIAVNAAKSIPIAISDISAGLAKAGKFLTATAKTSRLGQQFAYAYARGYNLFGEIAKSSTAKWLRTAKNDVVYAFSPSNWPNRRGGPPALRLARTSSGGEFRIINRRARQKAIDAAAQNGKYRFNTAQMDGQGIKGKIKAGPDGKIARERLIEIAREFLGEYFIADKRKGISLTKGEIIWSKIEKMARNMPAGQFEEWYTVLKEISRKAQELIKNKKITVGTAEGVSFRVLDVMGSDLVLEGKLLPGKFLKDALTLLSSSRETAKLELFNYYIGQIMNGKLPVKQKVRRVGSGKGKKGLNVKTPAKDIKFYESFNEMIDSAISKAAKRMTSEQFDAWYEILKHNINRLEKYFPGVKPVSRKTSGGQWTVDYMVNESMLNSSRIDAGWDIIKILESDLVLKGKLSLKKLSADLDELVGLVLRPGDVAPLSMYQYFLNRREIPKIVKPEIQSNYVASGWKIRPAKTPNGKVAPERLDFILKEDIGKGKIKLNNSDTGKIKLAVKNAAKQLDYEKFEQWYRILVDNLRELARSRQEVKGSIIIIDIMKSDIAISGKLPLKKLSLDLDYLMRKLPVENNIDSLVSYKNLLRNNKIPDVKLDYKGNISDIREFKIVRGAVSQERLEQALLELFRNNYESMVYMKNRIELWYRIRNMASRVSAKDFEAWYKTVEGIFSKVKKGVSENIIIRDKSGRILGDILEMMMSETVLKGRIKLEKFAKDMDAFISQKGFAGNDAKFLEYKGKTLGTAAEPPKTSAMAGNRTPTLTIQPKPKSTRKKTTHKVKVGSDGRVSRERLAELEKDYIKNRYIGDKNRPEFTFYAKENADRLCRNALLVSAEEFEEWYKLLKEVSNKLKRMVNKNQISLTTAQPVLPNITNVIGCDLIRNGKLTFAEFKKNIFAFLVPGLKTNGMSVFRKYIECIFTNRIAYPKIENGKVTGLVYNLPKPVKKITTSPMAANPKQSIKIKTGEKGGKRKTGGRKASKKNKIKVGSDGKITQKRLLEIEKDFFKNRAIIDTTASLKVSELRNQTIWNRIAEFARTMPANQFEAWYATLKKISNKINKLIENKQIAVADANVMFSDVFKCMKSDLILNGRLSFSKFSKDVLNLLYNRKVKTKAIQSHWNEYTGNIGNSKVPYLKTKGNKVLGVEYRNPISGKEVTHLEKMGTMSVKKAIQYAKEEISLCGKFMPEGKMQKFFGQVRKLEKEKLYTSNPDLIKERLSNIIREASKYERESSTAIHKVAKNKPKVGPDGKITVARQNEIMEYLGKEYGIKINPVYSIFNNPFQRFASSYFTDITSSSISYMFTKLSAKQFEEWFKVLDSALRKVKTLQEKKILDVSKVKFYFEDVIKIMTSDLILKGHMTFEGFLKDIKLLVDNVAKTRENIELWTYLNMRIWETGIPYVEVTDKGSLLIRVKPISGQNSPVGKPKTSAMMTNANRKITFKPKKTNNGRKASKQSAFYNKIKNKSFENAIQHSKEEISLCGKFMPEGKMQELIGKINEIAKNKFYKTNPERGKRAISNIVQEAKKYDEIRSKVIKQTNPTSLDDILDFDKKYKGISWDDLK